MNDSDVGYDMEWNSWMERPDLTQQKGWVSINKDGSVDEFTTWDAALKYKEGGSLMTKTYYEHHYKEIQNLTNKTK